MNSYNRRFDNNKSMDNMMEDINSKKEENKEEGPHILHLVLLARNLYVNDGVELPALSEMFKKHISLSQLFNFKMIQHWDEERARLLKIKNTLYGSAKQLVKMTLAVAKVDPTANNISAYKRAIESLIVLKKTLPVKNSGNKDGLKITPENIAEFANAAGLDYNPDIVFASELDQTDSNNPDNKSNTDAAE